MTSLHVKMTSFVLLQVNAIFGFEQFNFFFLEIFVHLSICLRERERERLVPVLIT